MKALAKEMGLTNERVRQISIIRNQKNIIQKVTQTEKEIIHINYILLLLNIKITILLLKNLLKKIFLLMKEN